MLFPHDFLAGAKYPELVRANCQQGYGIFWDTFTPAEPLIRSTLGVSPVIVVQGIWLDQHMTEHFGEKETLKAIQIAGALERLQGRGTEIYFSPFCEHRRDRAYMLRVFDRIRAVAPTLKLVNTPVRGGQFLNDPRYFDELHIGAMDGTPTGPYLVSYDGVNCTDADIEKHKRDHARAIMIRLWIRQYNLKKNAEDKTKRPNRKVRPTQKLINSVSYLRNPKGATSFPKGIFKSHSDQHGENTAADTQANKVVPVIPVKCAYLKLVTMNGVVIGKSAGAVAYKHIKGHYLYRFPEWGIDYARKAREKSGQPLCYLKTHDDKILGTVHTPFRDGTYRNKPD